MREPHASNSLGASRVQRCAIGAAYVAAMAFSAYGLAFARQSPFYGWLGWMALIPLFWAIRVLAPPRAMVCGLIWGGSLAVFSAADGLGGGRAEWHVFLLTAAPGAYTLLGALLTRWIGFSPFVLGVGWMGVELALGAGGFSNGLLASTQWDIPIVHAIAHSLGYVLVAFLVAYANAVLLTALTSIRVVAATLRPASAANADGRTVPSSTSHLVRFLLLENGHPRAPPIVYSHSS